ncbi:MAG: hypothetical protein NC111_02955 [Bacteroides sp.]|nr:hypothetical protein [Bacteroides sp.]MCM1412809.1 hypothetical protein [Bacteroides sp.]MCM1471478.1 hypothetical protein [Bacteroides sp.]
MNKILVLTVLAILLTTGKISACWYETYEPQYYLTYNIAEDKKTQQADNGMMEMWQKLLRGATDQEIKSLIYSGGYKIADIRSLNLTPNLNAILKKTPDLKDYIVLMREVEAECSKTVDPWYYYCEDDPNLNTLNSLAQVAQKKISGRLGDRYAVQAARALTALKKYDEIISISRRHTFQNTVLKSLFDKYLAGAFYHSGKYDKALKIYRKVGDVVSLRWTLDKLGMESDALALAKQLSMAKGNETIIKDLLQSHIHDLETTNDYRHRSYGRGLSPTETDALISTAKQASKEGLKCYKPIWQYTEGFAYLINPIDYAKADSVFAKIDLSRASSHLRDQVRTLRFITQCHVRPYNEAYKPWFAKEASWLCETGKEIIDAKRRERFNRNKQNGNSTPTIYKEWYKSFAQSVIFNRKIHQSFCYPLDMLHRAVDCVVVPKMLAASDTVSAVQLLDLVDHAGLTTNEIKMADDHGCTSICFAMECGADVANAALTSLNDYSQWSTLIMENGSIAKFPDRWNDLIGTLLLAEARYVESVGFFDRVATSYTVKRSAPEYDTNRNPFSLQFISDPLTRDKRTRMTTKPQYYKAWFARRMAALKTTMDNLSLPKERRANAGVEYAVGVANSVYSCWSLTQYGVGQSIFFPYQLPAKEDNRRATEIAHDFISDSFTTVDIRDGFKQSHQRLQNLRRQSEQILREQIAQLGAEDAASVCSEMGRYLTIKRHYPTTQVAHRLKSSCDGWELW